MRHISAACEYCWTLWQIIHQTSTHHFSLHVPILPVQLHTGIRSAIGLLTGTAAMHRSVLCQNWSQNIQRSNTTSMRQHYIGWAISVQTAYALITSQAHHMPSGHYSKVRSSSIFLKP